MPGRGFLELLTCLVLLLSPGLVRAGTSIETLAAAILQPPNSLEGGSLIGPPESRATWFFYGGIEPKNGEALLAFSTGELESPPLPGSDLSAVGPADDIAGVNFTLRVPENAHSLRLSYRILAPHLPSGDPSLLDEAHLRIHGESVALDPASLGPIGPNAPSLLPAPDFELLGTEFEGGVGEGTGWLEAIVPVAPGSQVAVRIEVRDGGETALGDLVLLVDSLRFDAAIPSGVRPGWAPYLTEVAPARIPPDHSQTLLLQGRGFVPSPSLSTWSLVGEDGTEINVFSADEVNCPSSERCQLILPALETGLYGLNCRWNGGELLWPEVLEVDRRRPVIHRLVPDVGPPSGGGIASLFGEEFLEIHSLYLGGLEIQEWSAHSSQRLDFVLPPGTPGPADLVVITSGGTGDLSEAYTYTVEEAGLTGEEDNSDTDASPPGDCSVASNKTDKGSWGSLVGLMIALWARFRWRKNCDKPARSKPKTAIP